MNKIKHACIILLSVLFMNNIVSMEDQDYMEIEQESQLLSLPAELMTGIINKTVIQQVKETINEWSDIFQQPKKINLQNIALVSQQFKNVLNVTLKSPSLKNYLNQLVKELKQARFDELFEDLKIKSIEEYRDKGLSTENLNQALAEILNQEKASKEDLKEAVKLILAGADVNAKNDYGLTALMIASKKGYKEIVQILIKTGADLDTTDKDSITALMIASRNGHKDVVRILIDKGANVNAKNIYSSIALMFASTNGYKDIVEILIEKNASINIRNFLGETAISIAKKHGREDIVQLLQSSVKNDNDLSCLLS